MFMYKASWGSVQRQWVDSVSDKCVFINGGRELKKTASRSWFETFEEAKEHLIRIKTRDLNTAKEKVKRYTDDLEKLEKLEDEV